MTRSALLAGLCLALAACGTPQERCIRGGTEELRTVDRLIEETERDLARGYTYQTEIRDVSFGLGVCSGFGAYSVVCAQDDIDTYQRAVPIDPELERRKLAGLRVKQAELRKEAAPLVEACRSRFPEG